ncbi:Uncharacterized protein OBRU01_26166 [Operophtera brumata]|uniref:Uncharacterized protein n=1 Tax=Operophtera brumata TaxID=104452 RepID=A0A0L7K3D4_OPEBR|nr:Uncharacterized protein OBRU01_26166 [Operophtera brumata]
MPSSKNCFIYCARHITCRREKPLHLGLIPAQYNLTKEKVRARLTRAFAVCITADGWPSRNNDCFIVMTAHYIVEEPATITIASDLLGYEYDLGQRVAVFLTDNAHNTTAALKIGEWRFWGCFTHSLNLIVQAGQKEIEETGKKVRAIETFFRRSAHTSAQLKPRKRVWILAC